MKRNWKNIVAIATNITVDKNKVHGLSDNVLRSLIKACGGSPARIEKIFGDEYGIDQLKNELANFLVVNEKSPVKAAKLLLAGQRTRQQQYILGCLANKLRPHSTEAFQDLGIGINTLVLYDLDTIVADTSGPAFEVPIGKTVPKSAEDASSYSSSSSSASSSSLGKAFTAFGGIRAVAKAASMAFNGSKDFVDTLGAWHIARGEDKNVLAEFKFFVQIPGSNDDMQVSVRFDVGDMAWHATCLDDRKIKLPEDMIIQKLFQTKEGRDLRKRALESWRKILNPKTDNDKILLAVLEDPEKFGIKLFSSSAKLQKTSALLKKLKASFGTVEKLFMADYSSGSGTSEHVLEEGGKKNKNEKKKKNGERSKAAQLALDAIKRYGVNKAGDWLDELLGGQLKDAVIKMYSDRKLSKMDNSQLAKELSSLKADRDFKRGEENAEHQSKRDETVGTKIAEDSKEYYALWKSKDKDTSVARILNAIVEDVQRKASELEAQKEQLAKKLKKLGASASRDDIDLYGPALMSLVNAGKGKEEIEKALSKMKSQVEESLSRSWKTPSKIILENSCLPAKSRRKLRVVQALLESEVFLEAVCQDMILQEGFKDLAGRAFNKVASWIPDKAKDKMKDFSQKAVKLVSDKGVAGMLSIAGIGLGIISGGWGAALALTTMYAIQRHGKNLKASVERQFKKFANSRGVVAKMDFALEGKPDSRYSMRYYVDDQVWRVVNLSDQNKLVSLQRAKAFVTGADGRQFRKKLFEIWNPLFGSKKGGRIDFAALLEQAKNLNIDEKALKMYKDFWNVYDVIVSNCISNPKIDVRNSKLRKS